MVYSPLTIAWGVVERDINRFICLARIHTYLSEFLIIFEAILPMASALADDLLNFMRNQICAIISYIGCLRGNLPHL